MFSRYAARLFMLAMLLAFATLLSTSTHAQVTTSTTREVVPFTQGLAACDGELVIVTGEIFTVTHTTISEAGDIHFATTIVYRNVQGVGDAGTEYRLVGGERQAFSGTANNSQVTVTSALSLNLVSQSGTANLSLVFVSGLKINALGEVTTTFENASIKCGQPV